jgi:SAM-dependent methyltransferase
MGIRPDERQPAVWNAFASRFDDAPDHGLTDPAIRNEWRLLLQSVLGPTSRDILDAGCGTGSLSLLLAELGHRVTGIDFAEAMIAEARKKSLLLNMPARFEVQDAAAPAFAPRSFDAILCRHVLWAMPDIPGTLQRWCDLVRPAGQLVLIEGVWNSGAGLRPEDIVAALPAGLVPSPPQDLSANPLLWGKPVSDTRYVLTAIRR